MLLTSLLIQQDRASRAFIKDWKQANTRLTQVDRSARYRTQRDFMLGFADGTQSRLQAARKAAEASAKVDYQNPLRGTSVALVLVDRQKQVDEWYDEHYGNLKKGRGYSVAGGHGGYSEGRAAAMRADHGQPGVQGARGELR